MLWPSRKQWRKWSIPSKAGVVSMYVGILALVVFIADKVIPPAYRFVAGESSEYAQTTISGSLGQRVDIEIQQHNVIDAQRGYVRIKIGKYYLNTSFDSQIPLRYEGSEYAPVLLTFENDTQFGPCINVVSAKHNRSAEVCLFHGFKFDFGLKRYWVDDFVFDLYFNDAFVWLCTVSGSLEWEQPPNAEPGYYVPRRIKFGENKVVGYFIDENDPRRRQHAAEYESLWHLLHE